MTEQNDLSLMTQQLTGDSLLVVSSNLSARGHGPSRREDRNTRTIRTIMRLHTGLTPMIGSNANKQ